MSIGGKILDKLVIFDIDGTVLNTIETIAFHGNRALKELGFKEMDVDYFRKFIGNSSRYLIEKLLETQGAELSEENIVGVMDLYHKYYQEGVSYLTHEYEGMLDLVRDVRKAGNIACAISNKPDHTLSILFTELDINKEFDFVQGQKDDVKKKPDPFIVDMLVDKYGVKKEDTYIIGDSEVDIMTGKNANVRTIGVLWGFRSKNEIEEKNPDFLVEDIYELRSLLVDEVIL